MFILLIERRVSFRHHIKEEVGRAGQRLTQARLRQRSCILGNEAMSRRRWATMGGEPVKVDPAKDFGDLINKVRAIRQFSPGILR